MGIISAKFVKSITGTDTILYDEKFQVAFMGRSNVGKSTLINSLTKRNALAHTSSTPGKTIRMDFFLINNTFYFVDFPGYGYAKRSQDKRDKLAKMILWYIMYSEVKKRLVILIIDTKVGITEFDREIIDTLRKHHIDFILVANKTDNLKIGQREKQLVQIRSASDNPEVIAYSSKEKFGREELVKKISSYISRQYPSYRV